MNIGENIGVVENVTRLYDSVKAATKLWEVERRNASAAIEKMNQGFCFSLSKVDYRSKIVPGLSTEGNIHSYLGIQDSKLVFFLIGDQADTEMTNMPERELDAHLGKYMVALSFSREILENTGVSADFLNLENIGRRGRTEIKMEEALYRNFLWNVYGFQNLESTAAELRLQAVCIPREDFDKVFNETAEVVNHAISFWGLKKEEGKGYLPELIVSAYLSQKELQEIKDKENIVMYNASVPVPPFDPFGVVKFNLI